MKTHIQTYIHTYKHMYTQPPTHQTWLIFISDMPQCAVKWRSSCICTSPHVTWLIHSCARTHYMCDMIHSYVRHDSFMCVTWLWLIHMCAMTHYRCDTTRPHISHDSSIYLTCCLIHILIMLQWAAEWRNSWVCKSLMWHDSFTSVTRRICISDTVHTYVSHDAVGRWVVESWVCRSRAFPFLGRLLCGRRGWPWLPTPPGAHIYMKMWYVYKCYSIYVTHICMCMHIHIYLYNSMCMYTYIYTTKCVNATPYTWPIYVCTCIYIYIFTTQYVCIRRAHGGDQTENSWISRSNSLNFFSIEWRGLLFTPAKTCMKSWGLSWRLVWNLGGIPWKLVRNCGSRNYFKSDLLRAW